MSETTDTTYTLELSNTPDGDGDYEARVFYGERVKHFYRKNREDAYAAALAWIARDRAHDPDDFETLAL